MEQIIREKKKNKDWKR